MKDEMSGEKDRAARARGKDHGITKGGLPR